MIRSLHITWNSEATCIWQKALTELTKESSIVNYYQSQAKDKYYTERKYLKLTPDKSLISLLYQELLQLNKVSDTTEKWKQDKSGSFEGRWKWLRHT